MSLSIFGQMFGRESVWGVTAMACSLLMCSIAGAQGTKSKRGSEHVTGKVTSVEKKGRAAKLIIQREEGDEPLEILVTTKTPFTIVAPGDAEFLRPGQIISSELAFSNNQFFAHDITVYHGHQQLPPLFRRDPQNPQVVLIRGVITAAEDEALLVNAGGPKKITIEAGAVITVHSNDTDLVPEGAAVELEGTQRGTRFLPTKITVTLDKPLVADEVFDESRGRKGKADDDDDKSSRRKKGKSKLDKPKGDPVGETADPFGLSKGKKKGEE